MFVEDYCETIASMSRLHSKLTPKLNVEIHKALNGRCWFNLYIMWSTQDNAVLCAVCVARACQSLHRYCCSKCVNAPSKMVPRYCNLHSRELEGMIHHNWS